MAGRDLIGRARTGSGKTLAFALPVIEKLRKMPSQPSTYGTRGRLPRVLVLVPTRELAKQVADDFVLVGTALTTITVYGGVPMDPQRAALWKGVDVIVGTPGRVMDLMEQGALKLDNVSFAILDEADRMLDMGFSEDVAKILDSVPSLKSYTASTKGGNTFSTGTVAKDTQVILFSATIPPWVKDVAKKYMSNPLTVDLVEGAVSASVDVSHLVLQCPWQVRAQTVGDLVRVYGGSQGRTIIFVETKKEADELACHPALTSRVECKALHGDVAQASREAALAAFKAGAVRCLVATDVAARGLDIKGVDLVIQAQPPAGKFSGRADSDTYVHRSGRTGRAGAKGTCITLFTRQQSDLISDLERATKNTFTRIGAPQPADIVRVSGDEAVERVAGVHKDLVDIFAAQASKALSDGKARGESSSVVLARALAVIAGYTKVQPARSLMSASEGYATYEYRDESTTIRTTSTIWTALRSMLPHDCTEELRGMTMAADFHGAVFDVPEKYIPKIKEIAADESSHIRLCTVLPELVQTPGSGGGASNGRGSFGGGGGRNFGGRFGGGGRGGGGGRFGGGGRGGFRR